VFYIVTNHYELNILFVNADMQNLLKTAKILQK